MSHFSVNPAMCRADVFKPSGKWYATIELNFNNEYHTPLIHDALRNAIHRSKRKYDDGFQIVCLEPYHMNSHPVSLRIGE